MNFEKTKITKKQYYELVKNNVHYNLGTIWSKDLNELDNKLNEVEIKLNNSFKTYCICTIIIIMINI